MARPAIPIERIPPPEKRTFYDQYIRPARPVIITGLVDGWPGKDLWSPEYFRDVYGDAKVTVAVTRGDGNLDLDLERGLILREITMAEYVAAMRATGSDSLYVIAEIKRFGERFERELVVPEICRGAPWQRSKLWFRNKGTTTQTHRGAPENLYSVVHGQKRFIMYPPRETRKVYPHSVFSKLPNYSPVDPDAPDDPRFPLFREAKPFVADLHAGDTLFIPSMWWHHVRTVEDTIAVNFWWSRGLTVVLSAVAHVYKTARGLAT